MWQIICSCFPIIFSLSFRSSRLSLVLQFPFLQLKYMCFNYLESLEQCNKFECEISNGSLLQRVTVFNANHATTLSPLIFRCCAEHARNNALKMADRCGTRKMGEVSQANVKLAMQYESTLRVDSFLKIIKFKLKKNQLETINCFRRWEIVERQTIRAHFRFASIIFTQHDGRLIIYDIPCGSF